MKPRVQRGGLGRLAERLGRQGVVLFIQGQLGRGVIGIHEVGLLLGDDVVKLVQHFSGIFPAQDIISPDRHQVLGRERPPGRILDQRRQRIKLTGGLGSVTALPIDLTTEQVQRCTRGKLDRRLFESGDRVVIPAPDELVLDLQDAPRLFPAVVFDSRVDRLGALVIPPGSK